MLLAFTLNRPKATWMTGPLGPDCAKPCAVARSPQRLFHLGEKSLTAAGAMGQVAAVVLDKHGNLVADGTKVTLTTDQRRVNALTVEGIAARLFEPGSYAGSYHAGAAIEGLQSGRVEYHVYADLGSMRPTLSGADRPWLPEDFVEFSSAPLVDKFGNPAFDGLGVTFRLDHSDRRVTQVSGFTVGGVARSRLLSRDIPSSGALSMTIADKVAPPDIVSFLPQVMEGTVTVEPVFDLETETAVLRLGPFQTTLGYALNDGAAVHVEMTTIAGTVLNAEAWVLDGRSTVSFPMTPADLPAKARIITVLGETRVTIYVADEKEVSP
jgi:hypothetical protein